MTHGARECGQKLRCTNPTCKEKLINVFDLLRGFPSENTRILFSTTAEDEPLVGNTYNARKAALVFRILFS
jgi:hypothetical protein